MRAQFMLMLDMPRETESQESADSMGRQLSVVPPGAQYVGGRRGSPLMGAQARLQDLTAGLSAREHATRSDLRAANMPTDTSWSQTGALYNWRYQRRKPAEMLVSLLVEPRALVGEREKLV